MVIPFSITNQLLAMTMSLALLLLPSLTIAQGQCQNYAPSAVIQGNKIYVSTTGEYLPIKGVNYYPRPNEGDLVLGNSQDFYTEAFRASWERDIAQFQLLGINAIRLYAVDPGQNHDAFMCALKAAGIYVIVGLAADCQNCAVQWQDPPDCYPSTLKQRGQFIIQQFARYENVLGFSAGNEISLSAASYLGNLPCQKKFLADMRQYMADCVASQGIRHIPIGVIFADHERTVKAQYYNCQTDSASRNDVAEFMGINAYLHCDGTATDPDQLIGYQTLLNQFQNLQLTVPVLWTEFGCLNPSFETVDGYEAQRNFLQVEALFSQPYRTLFNGGFVFEYSTEKVYSQNTSPWPFTSFGTGNYGLGYFSPEDCNGQDIPCDYIPFPQAQNLATQYNAVDVSDEPLLANAAASNANPPSCPPDVPSIDSFVWPTDAETNAATCPELVPVYCPGVPSDCVMVPVPSGGSAENQPKTLSPTTTTATTSTPQSATNATATATPQSSATSSPTVSPTAEENASTVAPSAAKTQVPTVAPTDSPIAAPEPTRSTNTISSPSTAPTLAPTDQNVVATSVTKVPTLPPAASNSNGTQEPSAVTSKPTTNTVSVSKNAEDETKPDSATTSAAGNGRNGLSICAWILSGILLGGCLII